MPHDQNREPAFFIGWAPAPRGLWRFLALTGALTILFAALFSYLIAATQDDPGQGAFMGGAEVEGILDAHPYPVIHVTQSDRFPPGTPLILSGAGKIGVDARADPLDGQLVSARGAVLARGDLAGLQINGGPQGLQATDAPPPALPVEDLGRWRLTGEICDGKCLIGAMRPGTGLAHKACANLCLIGGVPPVFVSTGRVGGAEFLLLGGPDGGSVTDALLDHTALLIDAEGRVERRGDLVVFLIEPETMELAR